RGAADPEIDIKPPARQCKRHLIGACNWAARLTAPATALSDRSQPRQIEGLIGEPAGVGGCDTLGLGQTKGLPMSLLERLAQLVASEPGTPGRDGLWAGMEWVPETDAGLGVESVERAVLVVDQMIVAPGAELGLTVARQLPDQTPSQV